VARLYTPLVGTLVIDTADEALAGAVEAEGVRCVAAPTIMSDRAAAQALAEVTVGAAA
jgi:LPPG:FO 2-phospho-L-lactate transferase